MTTNQKNNQSLAFFVKSYQQRINGFLADILPESIVIPSHLHIAMRYAVLNGGKRIRPLLVYAIGEVIGIAPKFLDYPAAAIELIHAYSLVHDDLPAMDDDDLRRGQPTCHKAFDEATAILVGDALQSLAFNVLAEKAQIIAPEVRIAMIGSITNACGSLGMAGGQALDLKATGQQLDQQSLELIHRLKTGALIAACIESVIVLSKTIENHCKQALRLFGNAIGLCFQIQDDILDLEGTTASLGKEAGSDQQKSKATYATLNSVEDAKQTLKSHYIDAIEALEPLGELATTLRLLANFIIMRKY